MVKLEQISPNFHKVEMGWLTVWFSYETPIAFHTPEGLVVSENPAGKTTGGHINQVSRTKDRVPHDEFIKMLEAF